MRAFLLLSLAGMLSAQPADELLSRARQKILGALDRLPNYTCVQTLQRDYRKRTLPWDSCNGADPERESTLERSTTDRFRLDVTVTSDGREIYSWAGARQFDANSLKQIVATGAVSTGSFGPFLINIFGQKGVEFTADGNEMVDGRRLVKFGYRVPQKVSRYDFQSHGASGFIPYDGAFWIDPATAELVRLEVHTLSMPHHTGTCEATTAVDFAPVSIAGNEYLLPRASHLEVSAIPGQYENAIAYSGCREYHSESSIHFDGGEDTGGGAAAAIANRDRLPKGHRLELALEAAIDTRTAAAGDLVRAHLVRDVVDKKTRRVVVPAGAAVEGRIVRLEHEWMPPQYRIGIEWQSLVVRGSTIALTAVVDPSANPYTVSVAELAAGRGGEKPHVSVPGGQTLVFDSMDENLVVPKGFQSSWISH